MTFDLALALDDWLVTGTLSRRKLAALQESHQRTLDILPQVVSLDVAGGVYCQAAELPPGTSCPVVVAAVLDSVDPINNMGSADGPPVRTIELLDELVDLGLMENEEADRCLAALGHGN